MTPNTYLQNKFNDKLRKFILEKTSIIEFVINKDSIFKDASVDTSIFLFIKGYKKNNIIKIVNKINNQNYSINQNKFIDNLNYEFQIVNNINQESWIQKIEEVSVKFGDIGNAYFGIQTFDRKIYVNKIKVDNNYKRIIDGGDISRYLIQPKEEYVNFIPSAIKSGGDKSVYENPKIVIRQIGQCPIASLDIGSLYSLNTIYNLYLKEKNYDLRYILGIINSILIGSYWKNKFYDHKPTFPKIKKLPLHSIPIREIDFSNKDEKAQHDRMVVLVERMLELNRRVRGSGVRGQLSEQEKKILEKQIEITDREIDNLVYELYGLTEEEIRIVEGEG